MFLQNFFAKIDNLAKIQITINDISTLEILEKSKKIEDKELILLGLLIYARILRIEKSEQQKESMIYSFSEFYKIHQDADDIINFNKVIELFNFKSSENNYIAIKKHFKTNIKLKKNKDNNVYYITTDTLLIDPYSSLVYTTFIYIWNNVNSENKVHLFYSFLILSDAYKKEIFTGKDAVRIPNEIVNEIFNLD